MAARYGYHDRAVPERRREYIKRPPDVFKAVLDEAGIALCTIGSGGQYLDRSRLQETLDNNGSTARATSRSSAAGTSRSIGIDALARPISPRLMPKPPPT